MKTDCIRLTATILIPFNADKFGDTGRAEAIAQKIEADLKDADGVTVDAIKTKKCRVDAGT